MADRRKAAVFQKLFNKLFNGIFRIRKGRLGFKGAPACILHTTGAKSGKARQTPLLYLALDGGRFAVVGSNGGDDRDPAWVHNLRKTPAVEAELKGQRVPMTASIADSETRAQLWPDLVAIYKQYANYQTKTDREIPVILLSPRT